MNFSLPSNFPALTLNDIVFAAVLAFIITWVIQSFSKVLNFVTNMPSEVLYPKGDTSGIIQKCYSLFPKEILQFNGKTIKRGMIVRVTTIQNKVFEGRLIGCNKDNVVCVLTAKYVVAHELNNIENIDVLKSDTE